MASGIEMIEGSISTEGVAFEDDADVEDADADADSDAGSDGEIEAAVAEEEVDEWSGCSLKGRLWSSEVVAGATTIVPASSGGITMASLLSS